MADKWMPLLILAAVALMTLAVVHDFKIWDINQRFDNHIMRMETVKDG